ncbi:MAG: UDP-N-acetylmuramoyl-L-alanyl-D-glutamate--2,6-diaminopimelate ligase [Candidatus Dependentiae bacterium]
MQQKIRSEKMLTLPKVWPVACHTDNVGIGSTFVAIKGINCDGIQFVADAIQKGATRIVVYQNALLPIDILQKIKQKNIVLIYVDDTRLALAQLSTQAYNHPAHKLNIVGITGTKGKTTTAFLTHHILQASGIKTALLSTVENKIGDLVFTAPLTTAQPDYLHMFFDQCVRQGITHLVMEVAAQAFSLHRVYGVQFDIGLFTNFAHEHLEFYTSMDDYFAAKCLLFQQMKPSAPVIINVDDKPLQNIVYDNMVHMSAKDITVNCVAPDVQFVIELQGEKYMVHAPYLIGEFNLYNVLSALHSALLLGVPIEKIISAIKTFKGVKGRMQKYQLPNGAVCYIDYAHTPDSYKQVLGLLRSLTDRLIVVFGCGGLRDKTKRSLMGAIAGSFADTVMLTSDNPRTEDPNEIVRDIKRGIAKEHEYKVIVVLDREKAIEKAYELSTADTIIALLGKGPDEFQIIGNVRHRYSDEENVIAL